TVVESPYQEDIVMAAPQKEPTGQSDSSHTNEIRDRPSKQIYNPYREDDYLTPQWKNITTLLNDATNDLEVGKLIHLQSFTLFDAMSAIEIMDPKMDTGMILEGDNKPPFNALKALSGEQVLWIMDHLLSCEMAWLSGHSLSQTVFTCMYIHHVFSLVKEDVAVSEKENEPTELVFLVLKAYVLATIKCCHFVWREMISGNVYEASEIDLTGVVERSLTIYLINRMVFQGLLNRLVARKHYLLAHTYLAQPQCEWFNKADIELQALNKMLHAKDEGSIQGTQEIGNVLDDAFDENINRILTSQTPPRPITLPSHQEIKLSTPQALESLINLTARLGSLCTIVDYKTVTSLLTSIYHNHRFLGSRPLEEVVAESIKDFIRPPSWWFSKERPSDVNDDQYREAKKSITMFLERAGLLLESLPTKPGNSPRSSPGSPSTGKQREFEVLHELNSIKQALNLGVLRAMLAFEQLDILKKPKLAFDDEETRYRHRFKAFADLWNFELPPFDYYKTTTDTGGSEPKELLLGAKWSFANAQDLIKQFIRNVTPENTNTELCSNAFKEVCS
ncbi:hypothetical protein INT43_005423, partial [Umbelopsis isabellina]